MSAISTSCSAMPLATSFTEPSPPTTTSSSAPSPTAVAASSPRWPGRSESRVSPSSPSVAAVRAICGQRRPVVPLSDAGLTRKTVLMSGRRGGERDARHTIYGSPQLVVGDPLEHAFDDDVADREQRTCVRSAQRAQREQTRGFHLDGEHAALRPPLVLAAVRVVEDVSRHDWADAHRLADLLRCVDGAVHDLPAR